MSPRYLLREEVMKTLLNIYRRITVGLSFLQAPMLLAVRLYWGFQFAQTGWGKLHNLAKITGFFASLNVPAPRFTAPAISTLEFVGGILLMLGLFSRPIAFLLACNMFVAYWTADHEALTSVFSDPGKFYAADPYTFLFASLMILIFGAGLFAADSLVAKRVRAFEQ
jgi:putative oxidoreductase